MESLFNFFNFFPEINFLKKTANGFRSNSSFENMPVFQGEIEIFHLGKNLEQLQILDFVAADLVGAFQFACLFLARFGFAFYFLLFAFVF